MDRKLALRAVGWQHADDEYLPLDVDQFYFCLRYRAGEGAAFNEKPGYIAFWSYNLALVMWIFLHFFPIGWPQLDAVYEHGFAYARSQAFYDTVKFWQWMRLPGEARQTAA